MVLVLGHTGTGQGLTPASTNGAGQAGCPGSQAQHLANWGGGLHVVSATGEQQSIPPEGRPDLGNNDVRIARCVRAL